MEILQIISSGGHMRVFYMFSITVVPVLNSNNIFYLLGNNLKA